MWSDASACLPQSLRSCHLIAHENPPPSCEVSRYRSVRPLPLKEESGPFFLACAIAASGRLARTMYATQSGESSAFSVIFSAFSDESPLFLLLPARFPPASLLRTDTPCTDGRKVQPIAAATCAERAGRRPVWRVRSEGVTNAGWSIGLLLTEHGGASGGSQRPAARRWNGLGAVRRESARKRRAGTQKKPADAMFTSAGAKMCSAVRCETARAAEQG